MQELKASEGVSHVSFEDALMELEAIVRRLEEGRVPLEEAVQAYERGSKLRAHCEAKLTQAKLRIEKVSLSPDNGVQRDAIDAL